MSIPFWRTGLVDISDAELKVLDVLADCGALLFRHLRDEGFVMAFNRPTHGMDDTVLSDLLQRWLKGDWIQVVRAVDGPRLELTSLGGAIWERERLPDWSRLVADDYRLLRNRPDWVIASYIGTSTAIVETFFATWLELRSIRPSRVRRTQVRQGNGRRYAWKALSPISAIMAIEHHEPGRRFDWTHYEQARCWWRDSIELMAWRGHRP